MLFPFLFPREMERKLNVTKSAPLIVNWHRWYWLWTVLKVNLKAGWIWNDRYLNTGYNKALTDWISWRSAFANCRFFQILSDYSTEIFALLACQLEGRIWKVFFVNAMWFYETENVFVRFSPLCRHFFSLCFFVYISRCVTHSVQRVLVKISFHTSVLICKVETSVFVNKVPVLPYITSRFSIWNIPRSILGG